MLEMYYFCSKFSFTPISAGDDALSMITKWISRIGATNAANLRKLEITINRASGTLMAAPGSGIDVSHGQQAASSESGTYANSSSHRPGSS